MTVGIIPTVKLNAITFDSPPDNAVFVSDFFVEWNTDSSDYIPGIPGHFELEIATDSLFNTLIIHALSLLSVVGFQYFNGSAWVALPTSGLAPVDIGSKVRYLVSGLAVNNYFWRVRSMQQV